MFACLCQSTAREGGGAGENASGDNTQTGYGEEYSKTNNILRVYYKESYLTLDDNCVSSELGQSNFV